MKNVMLNLLVAQSHREVMRLPPSVTIHPTTGKLCQSSSKWVPFLNQGMIRLGKERDGLFLSSAMPKSGSLTPTAPTAIRQWETFTFLPQS